jgi:hypothetical protein
VTAPSPETHLAARTTLAELDRLEALLAKATPGPWEVDGPSYNQIIWSSAENRVCFMAHSSGLDEERDLATAALIVAAVNALPGLIAALRATQESSHAG